MTIFPYTAKKPPENFSREKLAVFVHELTGIVLGSNDCTSMCVNAIIVRVEYIMRTCEDDTKSMFALVMVWQYNTVEPLIVSCI